MTVVEQIVHENAQKQGASAADAAERGDQQKLESDPWTFNFENKIGDIKTRDDEPLHVFKQNVRFYQDQETNTFNTRLVQFAIEVKGEHQKKIKKEDGQPNQEIFQINYLNLVQHLRKRELKSDVPVGDDQFRQKEVQVTAEAQAQD